MRNKVYGVFFKDVDQCIRFRTFTSKDKADLEVSYLQSIGIKVTKQKTWE